MDLEAGRFVGEYELLEQAGAGGFSVVWKARNPETHELVAIKVPRVEAFLDHLRREASLAARLHFPQVVEPLAVRLDADPPHIVLPWIEGQPFPLANVAPEPRAQRAALELFLELLCVIAPLHESGVVHGDLKPGNILVGTKPFVLDLGLARIQLESRLERSLAQSVVSVDGRSIAGTLDYMAPELFEAKAASTACDVYALGVLLHHLLTGRPPAFGVSPRALNPFLPPGTEELLRSMLHHDPARRVARAGDLLVPVERLVQKEVRCLAQRNGHERRRVFLERLETVKRGARALAVALAVVVATVGAFVLLSLAATRTRDVGAIEVVWGLSLFAGGTFFTFVPLLLGMTTINAWVLGVPEKTYKNRRGHPLWSFMMQ